MARWGGRSWRLGRTRDDKISPDFLLKVQHLSALLLFWTALVRLATCFVFFLGVSFFWLYFLVHYSASRALLPCPPVWSRFLLFSKSLQSTSYRWGGVRGEWVMLSLGGWSRKWSNRSFSCRRLWATMHFHPQSQTSVILPENYCSWNSCRPNIPRDPILCELLWLRYFFLIQIKKTERFFTRSGLFAVKIDSIEPRQAQQRYASDRRTRHNTGMNTP